MDVFKELQNLLIDMKNDKFLRIMIILIIIIFIGIVYYDGYVNGYETGLFDCGMKDYLNVSRFIKW